MFVGLVGGGLASVQRTWDPKPSAFAPRPLMFALAECSSSVLSRSSLKDSLYGEVGHVHVTHSHISLAKLIMTD